MPPTGAERLRAFLPRWLQGLLATDVAGAIGAQLDDVEALDLGDQVFVATATWGLAFDFPNPDGTTTPTGWERDLGLPTNPADGYAERRARVLARLQAQGLRSAGDFATLVGDILVPPQECPADVFTEPAHWVVFQPCEGGWPDNFDAVEAALAEAGPAHLGLYLAPWDTHQGLRYSELNRMAYPAANTPTYEQLNGALVEVYSILDIDAMSIEEIDRLEL